MKFLITYILGFNATLLLGSANFSTNSSNNYLIGEQAEFILEYKGEKHFEWPAISDTLTKDLEIVSKTTVDSISPGVYVQKFYITSWDTGYFVIPPIKVNTDLTAPALIHFGTVKINPTGDIKPIKNQLDTPFILEEITMILIYGLLILVLLIAGTIIGLRIYRKRKNQPKDFDLPPPTPTMEILWDKFNTLSQSKIWEQGHEKEFHTELSIILRTFLEFEFKVKALDETTTNIITQLNTLGINKPFKDDVIHILNFSDMVKFAKQKGVFSQHENALEILKKILESHQERESE